MKSKSKILATLGAVAAFSFGGQVMAQDGPNPYSDCGIGAALFPTHAVGATISNVIWDLGTTAITSATASPETCNGGNAQAALFILEAYDALAEETSRGAGENLDALLSMLEVNQDARNGVILSVRSNVAEIISTDAYETASATEKASLYYDAMISAVNAA